MHKWFFGALAFPVCLLLAFPAQGLGEAEHPKMRPARRLSPTEFPKLPARVVAELVRQGCTIPQASNGGEFSFDNVISGSFARRGQKDFAVLCSRDGRTHIHVVWGGAARCESELESHPDALAGGIVEPRGFDYPRAITSASQTRIASYRAGFGGPKPPDRSHAGIEDMTLEKASTIHYCARGKWFALQGMD